MDKPKIFVSSTVDDLQEERRIIEKKLSNLFDIFLSENEGARVETPIEVCMNEISNRDIFILIVGERYGHIPRKKPNSPYDGERSVTHGEFIKARERRKPILVFVKNTSAEREELAEKFLTSLKDFLKGQFYTTFSGINDFEKKLLQSISDLMFRLIRHKYVLPWKQRPNVIIARNADKTMQIGAQILGYAIQRIRRPNMGLSAGKTLSGVFHRFFQQFTAEEMANIENTNFFSVTEHFGISPTNTGSYYYWFKQAFFHRIKDSWGLQIPDKHIKLVPSIIEEGSVKDFFKTKDEEFQIHKVDLQIISPAPNGQIISIDPNYCSLDEMRNMGTSMVEYSEDTANYLVPKSPSNMDIIIGMKNLLTRSERLVIIAHGHNKRDVIRRMILGQVGNDCSASLIAEYSNIENLLYVIDEDCAKGLPDNIEEHVNIKKLDEWIKVQFGEKQT